MLKCLLWVSLVLSLSAQAQLSEKQRQQFAAIYAQELGQISPCLELADDEFKVCSPVLKNEGNAPYILQAKNPKAVVVLFHGLSDSPFFLRSIALYLQANDYTVLVPLTPGHGKLDADKDMQDSQLQARWYTHIDQVMQIVEPINAQVFVGGFSTGGAFATWYSIQHPEEVDGLLLFSGALELSSAAENMSRIWGMKWLAKWLDGEYQTQGPNPYKYPKVASYSGLVLMDVIKDIRDYLDAHTVSLPVFAAHSMADKTTLYSGIEGLTNQLEGEHTIFQIDESYDLCHADLPIDQVQIVQKNFNKSLVDEREKCAVPQANPLHRQMLNTLLFFLEAELKNKQ